MAYIPDEWKLKRLKMPPSAIFLLDYYCARANQETGETTVSVERISQDLEYRKDHINEYDRKLAKGGYISINRTLEGGRVVTLSGAWKPRNQRQVKEKTTTSQVLGSVTAPPPPAERLNYAANASIQTTSQVLGNNYSSTQNLGNIPSELVRPTQNLGNSTQNLGNSTQNLGAHIRNNQLMNQLMEPAKNIPIAVQPDSILFEMKVEESKTKKPKKKQIKPKSEFHSHPAVNAYRDILGYKGINAIQAKLIAEANGAEVGRRWMEFLQELAGEGAKYAHNVQVMILAYKHYEKGNLLRASLSLAWDERNGVSQALTAPPRAYKSQTSARIPALTVEEQAARFAQDRQRRSQQQSRPFVNGEVAA